MRRLPRPVESLTRLCGDVTLCRSGRMIERPFCFRDRGSVVTTNRAPGGVAIANGTMGIARGTPNGKHVRVAHEPGRKRIVGKNAAPACNRGRLLLHPTSTISRSAAASMIGSSSDQTSVPSPYAPAREPRSPNSSPHSRQEPRVGSSS